MVLNFNLNYYLHCYDRKMSNFTEFNVIVTIVVAFVNLRFTVVATIDSDTSKQSLMMHAINYRF